MSYASQQQGLTGPKLVAMIIALSIVAAVGAGLVIYLAIDAVKQVVERVTTVEVKEEEPPPPPPDEPPPPEEPRETSPPPPNAPPVQIELPRVSPIETTQRETPQQVIREPSRPIIADPGPPTPPAKKSQAQGAKAKGQKQWAARISEEYPRRAEQEGTEGTVGVRVTVTADGKATGCQVTSSSGSSELDAAACKNMERYSRFEPALDFDGNPTTGSYSTRITYKVND